MPQSQGEILRSSSRTYLKREYPKPQKKSKGLWSYIFPLFSILIPSFVLRCCGMNEKKQIAWREKFALVVLIFILCLILAFLTYGMNAFVCKGNNQYVFGNLKFKDNYVIGNGSIYYTDLKMEGFQDNLVTVRSNACKKRFGKQIVSQGILKNQEKLQRIADIHFTKKQVIEKQFIQIEDKLYNPRILTEDFYDDFVKNFSGCDATTAFKKFSNDEKQCFMESCYVGRLETKTYGCLLADFLLYISTVAIFSLIITRFILATVYAWTIRVKSGTLPTIMLVTCYSEGYEGIKSTLDSLNDQDHKEKIIFVIADGMIKGSENDKSTPEILIDMMKVDNYYPIAPMDYIALCSGQNRHNRALVYPGTYRETKMILVVKCGNQHETVKRGNRGKRDSQVILMGFFNHLLYKERMTPLDFDIYRKMKHLVGHLEPEDFELLLMVDADTVVRPDAVRLMAGAFESDPKVMGICGETMIANKWESWVTMIQVFEYYISHHLTKSFESVFGGVTCLPGCFCMYQIRSISYDDSNKLCVPIIANTFILNAYSVFETETLHEKNLLLLGEDRYLTTLLLKTFYKHKLIFLPHAKCETLVPAQLKVLFSQRRRWINSTVHNLFELVMVNNLCGTFCCSMQFVVAMELIGTLVLPVAIIFTVVLLISSVLVEPAWIPLIMLVGILGLPAVLILLTSGNISYIFWIVVYILSLPVWNLMLPTYAFWHFDDFTWGETRKVDGDTEHGDGEGTFDVKNVKLMHLEDYLNGANDENESVRK
ncbi:Chitin synthase 1 [Dictyocoela muelleri]|nr:Chitin synthase 1 [Dictyocoela muelleri]